MKQLFRKKAKTGDFFFSIVKAVEKSKCVLFRK